jgi:hypothetical protein
MRSFVFFFLLNLFLAECANINIQQEKIKSKILLTECTVTVLCLVLKSLPPIERMTFKQPAKIILSKEDEDDLIAVFGSRKLAYDFMNDASKYVHEVKKDLLPSSLTNLAIFKKMTYVFLRAVALLWDEVPGSIKKEMLAWLVKNPKIAIQLMKFAPALMKVLFGNLGSLIGFGGSLLS